MLTKKYTPIHSAIASLRFDAKCFNCQFDNTLYLELGHYTAKSNGGENANFILLCSRCNKAMNTMNPIEFFGDADIIAELDAKLALEFSPAEVFAELVRLVKIEKQYAENSKAKNHKLSTSAKRTSEMKGVKNAFALAV